MTIIDEQGLGEDHPRIAAEMEQGLQASVSISAPVADTAELRRALAHVLPALLDVLLRLEPQLAALLVHLASKGSEHQDAQPAIHNLRPNLVFDPEQSEVSFEEEGRLHSTRLTAQERAVLRQFLSAPRQWFSATQIASYLTRQGLLSAQAHSPERSVMTIISQLRMKLADYHHTLIRLNRRVGYAIFPQDGMA
jgi:DNA-binding response OmpR family regulator